MKTYVLFLAYFFSLSLSCLAMEQDQKKMKVENQLSSNTKSRIIPPLTKLALLCLTRHELRKNEPLPLLYATLKETYGDLPSHLTILLLHYIGHVNNAYRPPKYDPADLILTLTEYLMEKSIREASDETIKQKSVSKKIVYIKQEALKCKCQNGCSLEHTALKFMCGMLENVALKDMGQLRPLARATRFKFPLTLMYLATNNTREEHQQALKQLLCFGQDENACELIPLLDRNTLNISFPEGLSFTNYAQLNHCNKALGLLCKQKVCSTMGYTKDQFFYPNPSLQIGFFIGDIRIVKDFILGCQQANPPISLSSVRLQLNAPQDIYPLFYAINHGHRGVAKLLLENGISWDVLQQVTKNTPLHLICLKEDLELAQILLSKGASALMSKHSADGMTPLHIACDKGNVSLVQFLLDNGADVHTAISMDSQHPLLVDFTPLHIACRMGSIPLVELLLTRGAELFRKNKFDQSAFSIACSSNNNNLIQLLLKHAIGQGLALGSLIDKRCLDYLVDQGNEEMVQLLLQHIQPPATLLHSACEGSSVSLVKLLLEKYNLRLDTQDDNGDTPLHCACRSPKGKEIVPLILDKAQSFFDREHYLTYINAKNDIGLTPFDCACDVGYNNLIKYLLSTEGFITKDSKALSLYVDNADLLDLSIIKSLFTNVNDINDQDIRGLTLLHKLTKREGPGRNEVMEFLLSQGGYINSADYTGNTPLHTECQEDACPTMVKLLLDNGAYPNSKNHEGETPLHLCIRNHYSSPEDDQQRTTELLLAKGAHINAVDKKGDTPLCYVFSLHKEHRAKIAAFLLSQGALPTIENKEGKTPLLIAHESNDSELIELFEKHNSMQQKS
jgi:ankyrin repeat protein